MTLDDPPQSFQWLWSVVGCFNQALVIPDNSFFADVGPNIGPSFEFALYAFLVFLVSFFVRVTSREGSFLLAILVAFIPLKTLVVFDEPKNFFSRVKPTLSHSNSLGFHPSNLILEMKYFFEQREPAYEALALFPNAAPNVNIAGRLQDPKEQLDKTRINDVDLVPFFVCGAIRRINDYEVD